MLMLLVQVRDPVTGQVRSQEFKFDPANLTAQKMAAVRTKILDWATELAAPTGGPEEL